MRKLLKEERAPVLLTVLFCGLVFTVNVLTWWAQKGSKVPATQLVRLNLTKPPESRLETVILYSGKFYWAQEIGVNWQVPDCTWEGHPLTCHYVSAAAAAGNSTAEALAARAAVFVNHICWDPATIPRQYRSLPTVLFSNEPDALSPCMKRQVADVEMSYRTCAQVWTPYLPLANRPQTPDGYYLPPVPFDQKHDAVIYINSNCGAKSGRHSIIMQLMEHLQASNSTLSIHSYGGCSPNMDAATLADFPKARTLPDRKKTKLRYMSKYKFCVAMENSETKDYVSEKVYDALAAGCLPIYLGASNVVDFLPTENAVVHYAQLGSPDKLQVELERLASSKTAYEEHLAWRELPLERVNPVFRKLVKTTPWKKFCDLCGLAASWNQTGHRPHYTLCSANTTWSSS